MNAYERVLAVAALVGLGALAACGGKTNGSGDSASSGGSGAADAAGASARITPAARQEARQIYQTRCTVCHGPEGYGDGPGGAGLDPRPQNYHDAAWQDSVTDQEIERAIVYGGAAVGRSPGMVGNPDLGSKPLVVAALREMIREFGENSGDDRGGNR